ncbi:MAG: type II toxin-antitoxin system RelE/ParE family toxin [Rhizobiaceae bacterium]|nr:type II toxin-antitoxin system RelE/ParE family toxin [Rhizobiaceae bacterium]
MKVIFSPEAEADLESIGDYIARENPSRALSFTRLVRTTCAELAAYPRRFERLGGFRQRDVRRRVFQAYLIVYEVTETHVSIVRIIHGAMDRDVLFDDTDL